MSFVLQLDPVGQPAATVMENVNVTKKGERQQSATPALLIACPLTTASGTTTAANAVVTNPCSRSNNNDDTAVNDGRSSQLLQKIEAGNNKQEAVSTTGAASFPTQVKTVLTYPVAKGAREMQRTNTTQVLTTRVISQKLPSSTNSHQVQTVPVVADVASQATTQALPNSTSLSSPVVYPLQATMCAQTAQPVRSQTAIGELIHGKQQQQQLTGASNVQTTLHHKLHQVKTITTNTAPMSHIQRIHLKTPNVIGQSSQTVNLHKVKTVVANQSTAVQRNSLPRIQGIQQKSQVLASQMVNQFAVNQTNVNTQKIQQNSAAEGKPLRTSSNLQQQKAQSINASNAQKVMSSQSVCNNQKVTTQILSGVHHHPNHKIQQQQQQYPVNQQTTQQQGLQKLQTVQKTTVVARQQQQQQQPAASLNNVSKSCGGTVVSMHKVQTLGQTANLQQHVQQQQQTQTSHQKSQSAATLQKSQTMSTVTNATNRIQNATNVCKSNSVPNISKVPQNSNVITVNKQQQIASHQHQQSQTSVQLQQQLLQTVQQQQQQQQPVVVQKPQQQHSTVNANNLQIQKSHSITNIHQKVITTMPNNQRNQAVMNSKVQQQQQSQQQQTLMRIGIPTKNQTLQSSQPAGLKAVSQKVVNPMKTTNSQNTVPQPVQKNSNVQPMKSIQQQNVIGSQNAQKQPGCIKTIPPQKPVQRNHAQKVGGGGIKTSLNTNVTALKGPATSTIAQKSSIKTLLPQQTIASNIMAHKSSAIKIQQQVIQQKQLIMSTPYVASQQIRQQSGQLKTLLPIVATENRTDPENMNNTEFRASKEEEQSAPKSPVRRMPLPYECLQFVLQDHNYGAPPPRTPPPPSSPPHPKQQPINGAGSSTATSQHPYIFCPVKVVSNINVEDDAASVISSEAREAEPEGEETETAPEGEGDDEDSVTRCICDFEHDDGYMICCDRCLVWQHVDCMGIDRSNIPDEYLCEICRPRRVDRQRARALQMRKREELLNSDTSSDTSSTSSADTDVGVNATQKKRPLQQQQSVPRRSKSDAPAQVRRLNNNNNNNNNNNVAKRQRRDSHPRQSSAVRKKEATAKRGPGKRKAKRRMSAEDKEEDTQDGWGSNMAPLRQWIERYEEAVTNHYSPELRARISSIKVNGTHSDLRQSNMNVVATGKCRLNVHSNNLRFLVATMYLPPNTPVVELRGKYMLSTQHRSQHPQGRQHAQRPGPFVFFYRLPRDGTEVCVDTRTYGNDARFVRRSCKPNAEVKHCIEKGTLHLYIVTSTAIEKNAEITIKHEQHDLLLSPNPNSSTSPVVCACNNPRECQIATASQLNRRGSNGALVENADGRERRRRGRRNTVCEETESVPTAPSTSVPQTTPTATTVSTVTAPPPRRNVTTGVTTTTTRQVPKEEPTVTVQQPQTSPSISQSAPPETKKDKKKMTREERKMEAIMKAFERLEKAEQRKQEVQARNAQRKESSGTHSDNEDNHSTTGQSKSKQTNSERPLRRKRRKGRARTTSTSQSQNNRRTRLNSAESDVSSGDESNSMQSPTLLGQTRPPSRDVPYSSQLQHTPAKNTSDVGNTGPSGQHQGIPTAAGLLLALANSNAPPGPPSSPPLQQPTPVKSPTCDSGASSSSQSSTPSTPLSSACLLVAAAVGPLAPGLKFPKTKKVLMNEWLKESPDLPPPQANIIPQVSPLSILPTASTLPNSMSSALCIRQSDFPLPSTTTDPSAEFLSQSYAAKSLATLVQAANSVSGICDSPPQQQRKQQQTISSISSFHNNGGGCPVSTGSAKKRWLRQAISEECDSPNSRPESPPPLLETVAPPKKRRIARESLSSDNYTPPTTPTMLLPETTSNSRSLCPTEDEYTEHAQSPVVEQIDERHYEQMSVKEETNMELDETIAREKLSIDIPQSDLYIKCEEKTEISGIVKRDVSPIMKTENAEMKEEVSPKCEEDDMKPNCSFSAALHSDTKVFAKNELRPVKNEAVDFKVDNLHSKKISAFVKKEEEMQDVATGTVEIIDQNEPDTEMEEFSSPPWYRCAMEPDAILKQRVAEMQLEFGGGIAEIVNIASENEKPSEEEVGSKCQEAEKSDDNTSIDEFDVEAQMKKITGDDGNDYQEKIETSSERDKSMDGIEGLMESSKEDSDSEDKDMDDEKYCEPTFKLFNVSHEDEPPLKELDTKVEEQVVAVTDDDAKEANDDISQETEKMEQSSTFAASSEDSVFESTSSNIDTESVADPPKIFHSIPPLSERIRKKTTDPSRTPALDFEAAIIESTIDMDTTDEEESKNGEQKSMLSTALRELLEAKLDDEPAEVAKNDTNNEATNAPSIVQTKKLNSPERSLTDTPDSTTPARPEARPEEAPVKEEETKPKEIKRLKDPRTVVPNNMPAPSAFKPDALPPVKRKLSISEYRKRKQQSSGGALTESEPSSDTTPMEKSGARDRSDSASSGTSSVSSDEEGCKISHSLDLPGFTTLPLFTSAENEEKKGGEEGTIGWSAAPTLVERQRENLTERLKREFGLFLSDDEEERARKHDHNGPATGVRRRGDVAGNWREQQANAATILDTSDVPGAARLQSVSAASDSADDQVHVADTAAAATSATVNSQSSVPGTVAVGTAAEAVFQSPGAKIVTGGKGSIVKNV